MDIEYHWASEYARRKFGVTLNDGDDLYRLLRDIHLRGSAPEIAAKLTGDQVFNLLSLEAEYRALTAYGIYVGGLYEAGGEAALPPDAQDTATRLRKLAATRQEMFADLRSKFGAEEPAMAGAAGAGV
jgi:hypothetical protein